MCIMTDIFVTNKGKEEGMKSKEKREKIKLTGTTYNLKGPWLFSWL